MAFPQDVAETRVQLWRHVVRADGRQEWHCDFRETPPTPAGADEPPAAAKSDVVIDVRYFRDGKLHRDGDLPAMVQHGPGGVVIAEQWFRDGKPHRDGGLPAVVRRNFDGVITVEQWFRDSKPYRDGDLPVVVQRNSAGGGIELHYRDGKIYNSATK